MIRFIGLVVVLLPTACGGAAFESSSPDESPLAGAQSSAGARALDGSAGLSGGADGVAGGNTAGNRPDVLAGAGGELGGSSSSGAGGELGGPDCLRGWQGSACDTCTTSPAPASGETCAQLLACYEAQGPGNCDFAQPTADYVVKIAHDVWTCRGACQ